MRPVLNLFQCFLFLSFLLFFQNTYSQAVTLTASSGTATASFTTLKLAFDAINAGTHKGTIVIKINANTTETATASLSASTSVSTTNPYYSSITIYPTATALTISGALATPLITLNGADNVVIDGRVNATGSTRSLTITNTSSVATAGTSTIKISGDASNNTLQYCTIKGSTKDPAAGVLFFGTATTNGNDNNLIDNNNFTSSTDANRPLNLIYALGTNAKDNTSNTISNNYLYNFFNKSTTSYGINIGNFNTDWIIDGNSIYETATFTTTAIANYFPIYIVNTAGNNFTVSNNYIGGSAASCGGTAFTKTGAFANDFTGIYMSVGSTTASNIQGNVIKNINYTNTTGTFSGIRLMNSGNINVGTQSGNTIGSNTGTGSIVFTGASNTSVFFGIYSGQDFNCANNIIGSITLSNASTLESIFYGIFKSGNTTSCSINNNNIGSTTTANSIKASSAATATEQNVFGIMCSGTGLMSIDSNTIANLTNSSTNASLGKIIGINVNSGSNTISNNDVYNLTISNGNASTTETAAATGIALVTTVAYENHINNNKIHNITNSYSTFGGYVFGIYYSGANSIVKSILEANFVYGLEITGTSSTAGNLCGLYKKSGTIWATNNIISLGGTTKTNIYGIYETGLMANTTSLYFNTISIHGTSNTTTNKSYALYCATSTNTQFILGNMFLNYRSASVGGSNVHFSIYLNYNVNTNLTLSFNNLYSPNTGGAIGYFNGTNQTLFSDFTTAVATSITTKIKNVDPILADEMSNNLLDYRPSVALNLPILLIEIEQTGLKRTDSTTMGALETNAKKVRVSGSNGFDGHYWTFYKCFSAINGGVAGSQTGKDIEIGLYGNVTETVSAALVPTNSLDWNSLSIFPVDGAWTIDGNIMNSFVIGLQKLSNVIIDGRINRAGSTKSLTMLNTNATNTANRCTVQLEGANNCTIKYCILKSTTANFNMPTLSIKAINYGDNNNNLITNNDFTSISNTSGASTCIHFVSNSTYTNDSTTIINNYFYDLGYGASTGYTIYNSGLINNLVISDNHFFQTKSFAPSVSGAYYSVYINQATTTLPNVRLTVTGNYIGGSAPFCGGIPLTKTNEFGTVFGGIYFKQKYSIINVQGNVISNINWSNPDNKSFYAFQCADYDSLYLGNQQPNIIGSGTGTGSITLANGTSGGEFVGLDHSSLSITSKYINCSNNIMGSIKLDGLNFYGIRRSLSVNNSALSNSLIYNNTIGSTATAKSIEAAATSTNTIQTVYGIYINTFTNNTVSPIIPMINTISNNTISNLTYSTTSSSGTLAGIFSGNGENTIKENTISNLSNSNSNTSTVETGSVLGIVSSPYTESQNIIANTVYNLRNTAPSFAGYITGIYLKNLSNYPVTITRNFVKGLIITDASSTAGSIVGIKAYSGNHIVSNNIISLGSLSQSNIYGFYDKGITSSYTGALYFNTIYIGGKIGLGTNKSYALYSEGINYLRDFRNNILANTRSTTGGSNLHYAIYFNYATSNYLTLDYNNYYSAGIAGKTLGFFNSANISALPIVTGKDVESQNFNPNFTNAGGPSASDYTPAITSLISSIGTGITNDYAGIITRNSTLTSMGAIEITISKPSEIIGVGDWDNPSIWADGIVPPLNSDINIKIGTAVSGELKLKGHTKLGTIGIKNRPVKIVLNGFHLTAKAISGTSKLGYIKTNLGGKLKMNVSKSITQFFTNSTTKHHDTLSFQKAGYNMQEFGAPMSNLSSTASTITTEIESLFSESIEFPVGEKGYNPVTITNQSDAADEFGVTVMNEVYNNGNDTTSGIKSGFARIKRSWDITQTLPNSGSGLDLSFQWDVTDNASLTTPFFYNYTSPSWSKIVGTTSYTTTSFNIKGYTGNIGSFIVADLTLGLLPLQWLTFNATKVTAGVYLDWSTNNEINTKDFIIEHSIDRLSWKSIGNVAATGNAGQGGMYSFVHKSPVDGNNYYRIAQHDMDGNTTYSAIERINNHLFTSNTKVYPNPVQIGNFNLETIADGLVQIFNSKGSILYTNYLIKGIHKILTGTWGSGIYFLKTKGELIRIMVK